MTALDLINTLTRSRMDLSSEKRLQSEMEIVFNNAGIKFQREHRLDKTSVVDFFIDGMAVEVKIKGSAKNIYRQLERYAAFQEVKAIVLVTRKTMGLPPDIQGKPCYVISLGAAWL